MADYLGIERKRVELNFVFGAFVWLLAAKVCLCEFIQTHFNTGIVKQVQADEGLQML